VETVNFSEAEMKKWVQSNAVPVSWVLEVYSMMALLSRVLGSVDVPLFFSVMPWPLHLELRQGVAPSGFMVHHALSVSGGYFPVAPHPPLFILSIPRYQRLEAMVREQLEVYEETVKQAEAEREEQAARGRGRRRVRDNTRFNPMKVTSMMLPLRHACAGESRGSELQSDISIVDITADISTVVALPL
jgi:hypothetical protein